MTTFQDPPLQSRRAARQGERNAAYGQQPDEAAEPLTYTTQNRAPLPQYDGPDFRARRTPEAPDGEPADQPATEMLPKQDVPTYRPRDYSPEGRRSRAMPSPVPEGADGIEYRTQNARPQAAAPAPVVAAVEQPAAPTEHTMTRRELRALREAQGADAIAPRVAAPVLVAPASPVAEVVAEPVEAAPVEAALVEAEQVAEAPAAPVAPELSPFEALFAAPSTRPAPELVEDFAPDPAALAPEQLAETVSDAVVIEPLIAPEASVAEAPVAETPADEIAVDETPVAAVEVVEPSAPEAPVAPLAPAAGHWTTQGDLDDATQVADTITRSVGAGSGVITTSALVLPSLPNPEYSQLGTGDILVTGSIDLPRSLATSGAHPTQLDEHHLDHELDPGDHQIVSTDSQPVRAVKAISSHGSTRDVIVSRKPSGNRVLTALIISAAAMAAVVVTLLVVGLVTRVL